MLKHVVTWNVKDATHKAAYCAQAKAALEGLRGRIPGLLAIECGVDIGVDAANAHFGLYTEFTDRAALDVYQRHPLHDAARTIVGGLMTERRVIDWET